MKKTWIWLMMVMLLCLAPAVGKAAELRGYIKGQGWQYVNFGEYPYERDGTPAPVLWRILDITDGKALMLTEYIIDTQQVIFETDKRKIENGDYRCISSYAESDLCTWLNTEALDVLLGDDPMRNALIEQPGGGKLFILDMMEFLNPDYGFSATRWDNQPSRHATGTPYAIKARGLYVDSDIRKSPYWVSTIRDENGNKLALVGYNGHMSWGAYTRTNVGLRLSVRVDLSQLTVTGGAGTKKDPFVFSHAGGAVLPVPSGTPQNQQTSQPSQAPQMTPAPAGTAQPAQGSEGTALLSFVGNCTIGDSEQYVQAADSYHNTVQEKGAAWPFSLVQEYLAADDLTIANLEVVLTNRRAHTDKTYNLVGAPAHAQVLTAGSVEMVNTANNHCMDFHYEGYQDMCAILDEAGVARFGSVYPGQEYGVDDLCVKDVNGIRFGFVGFNNPQEWDKKKIAYRVRLLKEERGCDAVVVSLHWGSERPEVVSADQVIFAKNAIDAGADLVWGHHPYVLQQINFYKGKPILFSTGSFTFGTITRVDPATGIFQLTFEKKGGEVFLNQLQVIPCQNQGSPDYRPFVLQDEAARREVFEKLMVGKGYNKCEKLPESFAETGIVRFENGEMLP